MNSSASFLEGNEIQDLGGGQFKTTAASLRYGPLDQYLMGLRGPDEVPAFFYVSDVPAQFGEPARDPEFERHLQRQPARPLGGGRHRGHRRALARARAAPPPCCARPSSSCPPGGRPARAQLAQLERLRAAFPAFYAAGTDGRGEVDPRIN